MAVVSAADSVAEACERHTEESMGFCYLMSREFAELVTARCGASIPGWRP
jgi:hypothetical protein